MWSYSGNPESSDKDRIRFIIGDTNESMPQITDEEIAFALNIKNADIDKAAVLCLESIVANLAKEVDYKIGPEAVNASDRYKQYKQLLDGKKEDKRLGNAIPTAQLPDTATCFDIGMHDNH